MNWLWVIVGLGFVTLILTIILIMDVFIVTGRFIKFMHQFVQIKTSCQRPDKIL